MSFDLPRMHAVVDHASRLMIWKRDAWRRVDIGPFRSIQAMAGDPGDAWAVDTDTLVHFSTTSGRRSRVPLP